MKKKKLIRWGEDKTLDILERGLKDTPYRTLMKVRLHDVIDEEREDKLSSREKQLLWTAHLDFVVLKKKSAESVFAIEFDGPHHLTDEKTIERDTIKNRLCMKAELPLLRIGYTEIKEHDQMTLLEFMVQRFIAWQKEEKEILQEINEFIASLTPEEFEQMTEGGMLDPSIDPTVKFDFRHPFLAILRVARRLYAHFGIFTTHTEASLHGIYSRTQLPIVCYTMPVGTDY